jgi:uncharacterized circularly permuted ATP-grasp superfamily protein
MVLQSLKYSLDIIREEARRLVRSQAVSRKQPIYNLCRYIPAREWAAVEWELEQNNFLFRDCIGDLMGREDWEDD